MPPGREYSSTALEIFEAGDELAREGEPDALKGACPVREGLHRDRLFASTSMAR